MAPRKPRNSFSSRDLGFTAKIEINPETDSKAAVVIPTDSVNTSEELKEADSDVNTTIASDTQSLITAPVSKKPSRKSDAPKAGVDTNIQIKINFGWPDEIVKRAEPWAEKARCPAKTILQKSFNGTRADLVKRLEGGLKHTEIPHERAVNVTMRLQSSLTISPKGFDRLCKELDPEGMVGIATLISRWAREISVIEADKYLKAAGY